MRILLGLFIRTYLCTPSFHSCPVIIIMAKEPFHPDMPFQRESLEQGSGPAKVDGSISSLQCGEGRRSLSHMLYSCGAKEDPAIQAC